MAQEQNGGAVQILKGVEVFFYMGQECFMRYGKPKTIERVQADYNMSIGHNTTVPVTVYPRKFNPILWSPEQPLSERKSYTVDVRVLEGREGFYGYAEPSKGSILLDSEQVAVKRVEGVAIEKLEFKVRGRWWDKSPKFVAYSRQYPNRPVVLAPGMTVNEGELVAVVLTENPRARPGDDSLVGKLMGSQKKLLHAASDTPTVELRTPTILKVNVTEPQRVDDFQYARTRVGIYDILSSKRLGIKADENSRPQQIRDAVETLSMHSDPVRVASRLKVTLPLNQEAHLCGFYDAIQAAGELALKIAIEKFGDEPESVNQDEGTQSRRQRRDRRRNHVQPAEQSGGQETAVSTESEPVEAAIAVMQEAVEAEGATQETAAEPEVSIAERIAAKAAEMKEDHEVVAKAYELEVAKASARGATLSLEDFLSQSERVLRFAVRAAKAAK